MLTGRTTFAAEAPGTRKRVIQQFIDQILTKLRWCTWLANMSFLKKKKKVGKGCWANQLDSGRFWLKVWAFYKLKINTCRGRRLAELVFLYIVDVRKRQKYWSSRSFCSGRHLLTTIDNSKGKGGVGGSRCSQRPVRPNRVKAGSSSVGRSRARAAVLCQGGCMGGEQWKCCLITALQMNTDALLGGAEGGAGG